jgi:hypothetical protein
MKIKCVTIIGRCTTCGTPVSIEEAEVAGNGKIYCSPCFWGEHNVEKVMHKCNPIPVETYKEAEDG